jgi:hypothetical protein
MAIEWTACYITLAVPSENDAERSPCVSGARGSTAIFNRAMQPMRAATEMLPITRLTSYFHELLGKRLE